MDQARQATAASKVALGIWHKTETALLRRRVRSISSATVIRWMAMTKRKEAAWNARQPRKDQRSVLDQTKRIMKTVVIAKFPDFHNKHGHFS